MKQIYESEDITIDIVDKDLRISYFKNGHWVGESRLFEFEDQEECNFEKNTWQHLTNRLKYDTLTVLDYPVIKVEVSMEQEMNDFLENIIMGVIAPHIVKHILNDYPDEVE